MAALAAPAHADPCPSDLYEAAQHQADPFWDDPLEGVYYVNEGLQEMTRSLGGAPGPISRLVAAANIAVYDTLNSIYWSRAEANATGTPTTEVCGWEPYTSLIRVPLDEIDSDYAIGWAAWFVVDSMLAHVDVPNGGAATSAWIDHIQARWPDIPTSRDGDARVLGLSIASELFAMREFDGWNDATAYTPASSTPGAWRPTGGACTTAATPNWGMVTPWTLTSGSQFRQTLPGGYTTYSSLLASSFYATQFQEVKDYGKSTSTVRSADQTEQAWFWANDADGTYKPPGQLLDHTETVAKTQPNAILSGTAADFPTEWSQQPLRVARLFAEVSLAMADAAIASWDQKYLTAIDLWRPITGVQQASTDGNASTVGDATWAPLGPTPCFPAWVSGHATFAGAWGQIMENEFAAADANDPFPLELETDDPNAANVTREFDSFDQAAEENAFSRIFLGVHWRVDGVDGLATGRGVANQVTGSALRWNKTCAGWNCFDYDLPVL